jgi:hypothetical protein
METGTRPEAQDEGASIQQQGEDDVEIKMTMGSWQ